MFYWNTILSGLNSCFFSFSKEFFKFFRIFHFEYVGNRYLVSKDLIWSCIRVSFWFRRLWCLVTTRFRGDRFVIVFTKKTHIRIKKLVYIVIKFYYLISRNNQRKLFKRFIAINGLWWNQVWMQTWFSKPEPSFL